MGTRYIQKNKEAKWEVSSTKNGKSEKNFITEKEAIKFASNIESTKVVMVKDEGGKSRKISIPRSQKERKINRELILNRWIPILIILSFLIIGIVLGLYFGGAF